MLLLNEKKKIRKDEILDFNTSYVVIKLGCNELPKSRDLTFQYILCCY